MPFDERILTHGPQPVVPEIVEYDDGSLAGREWPDMNHYAQAKGPTIARLLRAAGWEDGGAPAS